LNQKEDPELFLQTDSKYRNVRWNFDCFWWGKLTHWRQQEPQCLTPMLQSMASNKFKPWSLVLLRRIAATRMSNTLQRAVEHGDAAMVALKAEAGDDVSDTNAFRTACALGRIGIVRLLLELPLEKGVEPAANDNFALLHASTRAHTEIVRLLLDLPLNRGVDPAVGDNSALRSACYQGHTEIVRLLLDLPPERGVNPAADNNAALRTACYQGHTEIVRLLLELPLDRGVAAYGNEPFQSACLEGHMEIVRLLLDLPLERGVDPSTDDNLRGACYAGHSEIICLLLDLPKERGTHRGAAFRMSIWTRRPCSSAFIVCESCTQCNQNSDKHSTKLQTCIHRLSEYMYKECSVCSNGGICRRCLI